MKPKVTVKSYPTSGIVKPKGLFEAVEEELRLRNYSPKTVKVYLGQLHAFVRFFKPRHPRELSDEDIRRYLLHLMDNGSSRASVDQAINVLRFLYLEAGVDIRYIQSLLGHARLETTSVYTKVRNPSLLKIKSPL